MGNGSVKATEEALVQERLDQASVIKLLLLGSGESGKSTLIRQMKLLHLDGFTEDEKAYFRDHIYRNLAECLTRLPEVFSVAGAELGEDQIKSVEAVKDWGNTSGKLEMSSSIRSAINEVLANSSIGEILQTNSGTLTILPDSASYFFDNHDRITSSGYVPENDDIVRCRITTTGVHEVAFTIQDITFKIIDVGGQRGQRKKWVHQFEGVQGMIFVIALSDYCRLMVEDNQTNRMHDSLDLFGALIGNEFMKDTAVLIFFNKMDVFEEKIKTVPITECFPDATATDPKSAMEFIKGKFVERKPPGRNILTHFTNATDRRNVRPVLSMTFDVIIKANIRGTGMV